MSQDQTTQGLVLEALPNLQYKVELEDGRVVCAYTAGKMKLHKIRVLVGDKVEVVLDPYGGKCSNRIVRRK